MAHPTATVTKPQDWDKAVAAAYLRLIGHTQQDSADGAGVGRRTLQRWEESSFWHEACEEASDRWLSHLTEKSRVTLLRGVIDGDAHLSLKVLERVDDRLLPPAQRLEHGGHDGEPIKVEVTHTVVDPADED